MSNVDIKNTISILDLFISEFSKEWTTYSFYLVYITFKNVTEKLQNKKKS